MFASFRTSCATILRKATRQKARETSMAGQRRLSTRTPPQLVRDYVDDALYNPEVGYFSRGSVVHHLPSTCDFQSFLGETEYREYIRSQYIASRHSWLTPAEIFKPYYARAFMDYVVSEHEKSTSNEGRGGDPGPLRIIEIGGGRGTFARSALDYLKLKYGRWYDRTEYTIVEASGAMVKEQRNQAGKWHQGRFRSVHSNITAWEGGEQGDCFIIALEVLDNMPHDVVYWDMAGRAEQVELHNTGGMDSPHEVRAAVSDQWIRMYLDIMESSTQARSGWHAASRWLNSMRGMQRVHIPTTLLQFINKLHLRFPRHHAILVDFDELPDSTDGKNGPVVQEKVQGENIQHPGYLHRKYHCDILYPTDFGELERLYVGSSLSQNNASRLPKRSTRVFTQRDFILENSKEAHIEACRSLSGYNPLLSDYSNMSVFCAKPVE